jgi:S1-C subfamily serine protease
LGTLIQTDARLGWNAGGGALVNMRGELVGITTTASTIAGHEQPAGYAIPLNATMRRIIDTLKQGREVEYGMLGVSFNQSLVMGPTPRSQRLTLAQVYPGSPAARAGLATGDVITSVNGQRVEDVDAVQLAVSVLPPLSNAEVAYQRGGRQGSANVVLAKLAVAGKTIATAGQDRWQGLRVDYGTALDANGLAQAISSGAYDAEGCVLVVDVEKDSPAWKAGVRPGMFISHAGGKRVSTPAEFQAATGKLGDEFDIRLTKPEAAENAR